MKFRTLLFVIPLATAGSVHAAQTYQDTNILNTWNTADTNWDAGVAWANTTGSDAIFGGTGETVAVSAVNARDITFGVAGYTLTGSTITLGATSALTANADATINSGTAGAATTVSKQGTGNLTLGGGNAFTGQLVVNAGRITVNAGGTQGSAANAPGNLAGASSIVINNGGTLDFRGSSTSNLSSGANTLGSNSKPITINTGGTLLTSSYNVLGYWNQNQYPSITMAGGTFTPNMPSYINRLTINQSSSAINGTGAFQSWQTSGDFVVANVDASIASAIRINDNSPTFNVAAAKTLTISGALTNFNGGTSTGTGKFGFTKSGTGTLLLGGINNFGGIATVSQGTLKLGSPTALGAVTNGTSVTAGAVLDLNGQTVGTEALTLNGTGVSSAGALINSSATAASLGGAISVASATTIGGSGNFSLGGNITGAGALSKTGGGTVTFTGFISDFTGGATIQEGTLALTQGLLGSNITVADGATLAVAGGGNSVQLGNLTMGVTTGSSLSIPYFSPNAPVSLDLGNLETRGITTVKIAGNYSAGTFPLITAASRTGTGTFALGSLPRGVTASLLDSGTALDLKIEGIFKTTWKGDVSPDWDINTTQNWKLGATNPTVYLNDDNVLFDGTAAATAITLSTSVSPASVAFDFNSPTAYSIAGAGAISGVTGISKAGSGTVTLANVNTFTGPVNLTAGSLQVGGAGSLGSGNYAAAIQNEGTIQYSSSANQILSGSINGTGSILKDTANSVLTLTGGNYFEGGIAINAGSLSIANGSNVGSGPIAFNNVGTGLTLTGTSVSLSNDIVLPSGGTGNVTLLAPDNSSTHFTGTLSGGAAGTTLFFQGGINGSSSGSLTLHGENTGLLGIINVQRGPLVLTNSLAAGGTQILLDSNNNANGALQLAGDFTIGNNVKINYQSQRIGVGAGITAGINGVISENSANSLEKVGAGTLRLGGINTYTGNTVVSAGTLELADNARLTFKLGATVGTANTVSGAGTVVLDGAFAIDTTAAASSPTGTWVLENVPSLTGPYGATFKVVNPDGSLWTSADGDTWTKPGALPGSLFTFAEATGTLTLTAASGGYDTWLAGFTFPGGADTTRSGDPDGDGFSNLQEFIFGTSPVVGEGTLTPTETSGTNLIIRWKERTSGATYSLKSSASLLNDWGAAAGATLSDDGVVNGSYKPRKATVPMGAAREFFRIEGVEN